jgi:hypothetical protein
MDLNMPKDTKQDKDLTEVKQSGALTIMLGKGDQVYYYEGELTPENASTSFKQTTFKGIRDIIINKRKDVISNYKGNAACEQKAKDKGRDPKTECADEDFVVVIKPDADATYKNTVDILDEMTINNVKRFAMVKISDTEKELVKATEQASGVK